VQWTCNKSRAFAGNRHALRWRTLSLPAHWSEIMRLPRFSIANALALIAILAVALAALRNPSYLWANITFSLALGALVVAIVNAVYGREAGRAYWLGFSLCGGIYLAVCSMPGLRDSVCPRLATEAILDFLYPHLSPAATTPPAVPVVTANSPGVQPVFVSSRTGGATFYMPPPPPMIPRWAAWTQPDRTASVGYMIGTVQLRSSEAFRQIGHSMCALLVAVLGAIFARHRYRISVMARPGS
jgi:hypothetical protein